MRKGYKFAAIILVVTIIVATSLDLLFENIDPFVVLFWVSASVLGIIVATYMPLKKGYRTTTIILSIIVIVATSFGLLFKNIHPLPVHLWASASVSGVIAATYMPLKKGYKTAATILTVIAFVALLLWIVMVEKNYVLGLEIFTIVVWLCAFAFNWIWRKRR